MTRPRGPFKQTKEQKEYGKKWWIDDLDKECPDCGGTGIGVRKVEVKGKERHQWIEAGCPKCNGTGKVSGIKC